MNKQQNFITQIMEQKVAFLVAFFCIFTLSYGLLFALDFYPEPVTSKVASTTASVATTAQPVKIVTATTTAPEPVQNIGADTLPLTLIIPALDRTVTVLNPSSNTVAAMDAALLKGVIRHPESATFGEEGTMFILGHSSYLPTVHNRNFQALNGIQNLKWGDTITINAQNTAYTYKVEKTYKAKASDLTIPISGAGKHLTLATCNSFGTKDDRYIVEATLVKTTPIKA